MKKGKKIARPVWPKDWNPKQGWPTDPNAKSPDGRTWGELDAELKKQGTSIDDQIRELGGVAEPVRRR